MANSVYNSIEITDSDEEANFVDRPSLEPKCSESPPPSGESKANSVNEITPKKATPAYLEMDASVTSPSSSDKTGTSPSTGADINDKSNAKGPGRQRSRKSQHQTLRMSPADLQFETIALEDEESRRAKMAKVTDEPQLQRNVVDAISNLIAGHEMQALIKRIAKERVRCNFLLATYQLPDMNFALNTPRNTQRYQFRERLRQRNEKNLPNAATTTTTSRPTAPPTSNANANANKGTTSKGIVRARQPQS